MVGPSPNTHHYPIIRKHQPSTPQRGKHAKHDGLRSQALQAEGAGPRPPGPKEDGEGLGEEGSEAADEGDEGVDEHQVHGAEHEEAHLVERLGYTARGTARVRAVRLVRIVDGGVDDEGDDRHEQEDDVDVEHQGVLAGAVAGAEDEACGEARPVG